MYRCINVFPSITFTFSCLACKGSFLLLSNVEEGLRLSSLCSKYSRAVHPHSRYVTLVLHVHNSTTWSVYGVPGVLWCLVVI